MSNEAQHTNRDSSISDQLTNRDTDIPRVHALLDAVKAEVVRLGFGPRPDNHIPRPDAPSPSSPISRVDAAPQSAVSPSAPGNVLAPRDSPASVAPTPAPRPSDWSFIRGAGALAGALGLMPLGLFHDTLDDLKPPRDPRHALLRRERVGSVQVHPPDGVAPQSMPPPPPNAPRGLLLVRLSAEERRETGELLCDLNVTQPGGYATGQLRHTVRLRGNRFHLIRHLAEVAREHASVPADCPVRIVLDVDV